MSLILLFFLKMSPVKLINRHVACHYNRNHKPYVMSSNPKLPHPIPIEPGPRFVHEIGILPTTCNHG